MDGSQYFSSEKIHCPGCLVTESKNGTLRYHHQILQPAIVHSGIKQVLPLAPEHINNQDGTQKQDCEINAAKRSIRNIQKAHPKLKIIITGDSLFQNSR